MKRRKKRVMDNCEIEARKVKRRKFFANGITIAVTAMFSYFVIYLCLFYIFPAINAAGYTVLSQGDNVADMLLIYYPGFICLDGVIAFYAVKLCKFLSRLAKTLAMHAALHGFELDEDSDKNEIKFVLK